MPQGIKRGLGEKDLADIVYERAVKVVERHGLDKANFLPLKEVRFPHGRADVVIYGLYNDLYVLPFGVEVKKSIVSGTDLLYCIDQIRGTYEHAFTHIYLAVHEAGEKGLIENYLEEVGYGLLRISGNDVEVDVEARPRKVYRSERDYCEVSSRGLLMMATIKALIDEGFKMEDMNVSSLWVGLKWPINYCAFLRGNHTAFGVYALNLKNVKRLLEFLVSRKTLLQELENAEYRIWMESYPAVKGVRGYVQHFDEQLSVNVVEKIIDAVNRGVRPTSLKKWGFGLGIYKRLWSVESVPTYPTALKSVEKALDDFKAFKEIVKPPSH
jgi:hypothetical protein